MPPDCDVLVWDDGYECSGLVISAGARWRIGGNVAAPGDVTTGGRWWWSVVTVALAALYSSSHHLRELQHTATGEHPVFSHMQFRSVTIWSSHYTDVLQ